MPSYSPRVQFSSSSSSSERDTHLCCSRAGRKEGRKEGVHCLLILLRAHGSSL
jgi:hypothetical protein